MKSLLRRAAVAVAGGVLVVVGLLLVPLPGPGWAIVFSGVAVLGTEFPWAERLSHRARGLFARGASRIRSVFSSGGDQPGQAAMTAVLEQDVPVTRAWEDHAVTSVERRMPPAPLWIRHPRLFEVSTPVLIAATIAVGLVVAVRSDQPAAALTALALSASGFALSYRLPFAALMFNAAAPLVAVGLEVAPILHWQVATFTAFLFTYRGLSGWLVALLLGSATAVALGVAAGTFGLDDPIALVAGLTTAASAATGSALRAQGEYWGALQATTHEAVAGRDAAIERSIAEERLRIARDLHDSVGHEIAVMSMHLGAAQLAVPPDDRAAVQHLDAVRAGVKSLLAGTQEILMVLRSSADAPSSGPPASHRQIPQLVAAFRAAGLDVDATVTDLSVDLPLQVSAAAYRIAQEALTNAERHGDGKVSLRVHVGAGEVIVDTVNAIRTVVLRDTAGTGQGLIGMRERALAVGGQLDARQNGREFRLHAALPLRGGSR